jgi:hypothetical protein
MESFYPNTASMQSVAETPTATEPCKTCLPRHEDFTGNTLEKTPVSSSHLHTFQPLEKFGKKRMLLENRTVTQQDKFGSCSTERYVQALFISEKSRDIV